MCRLFGLLGEESLPPDAWLVRNDRSLLVQSNVSPSEAQSDGWGVGWYASSRTPHLELGLGGAYEPGEVERFREVAKRAKGPVVIAHLRHASNPLKLSHDRLIGRENCQPFSAGSVLFAHNGMIPLPRETRPLLGRHEASVRGVNDSEVLFYLFLRHLEEIGEPVKAYSTTIRELVGVWEAQGSPADGPYTGLNLIVSRGPNELWGFCHWRGEHGTGLVDRSRPYYRMTFRADAKHAVLGSEPFDALGGWSDLDNGQFFHAQSSHGLVATTVGAIPGIPSAPGGAARHAPPASPRAP